MHIKNIHGKIRGKGLTGLANVGNSCYLNSCMQILSHTYELNDFLMKEQYKKNLNNKPDSVVLIEWTRCENDVVKQLHVPHGFGMP